MTGARCLLLAALLCAGLTTTAQDGPGTGALTVHPDYLVQQWTVEDGLPVNTITGLAMGPQGYLWATTYDGLVRFDGRSFTVFNAANTPGLDSNRLRSLFSAGRDGLWFVTEAGGTYHLDTEGVARVEGLPEGRTPYLADEDGVWFVSWDGVWLWSDGVVRQQWPAEVPGDIRDLERKEGTTWVLTENAVAVVAADGRTRRYPFDPAWDAHGVGHSADGALWLGTEAGLARLRGDRFELITNDFLMGADWGPTPDRFWQAPDGTFWARGFRGWVSVQEGLPRPFAPPGQIGAGSMGSTIAAAPDGAVWRMQGRWLFRDRTPILEFPDKQGLFPYSLVFDPEGNLWIGTEDGLLRLRRRVVQVVSLEDGLGGRNVYPVLAARDGSVWAGVWGGAHDLVQLRGGRPVAWFDRPASTSSPHPPQALLQTRAGTLWAVTGDLYAIRDGRATPVSPPPPIEGLPRFNLETVEAMLEDRHGRIWLGSFGWLARLAPAADGGWDWTVRPIPSYVAALVETRTGDVLVASKGSGLGRVVEDEIEWLTTEHGLASNQIRDVYEDERGVLWIATEDRGLCRLDRAGAASLRAARPACLSSAHGLLHDSLHRILPDDQGRLWINTNRGIFAFDRGEADAVAAGRAPSLSILAFTEADGLRNREGNGGRQPAGSRGRDGRLYFPTQDGVAILDPVAAAPPMPPRVVIEHILVGGERVSGGLAHPRGTVEMGPGVRDLRVHFAGLSFTYPDAVRYRVRLDGYDDTWRDLGTVQEEAFTNLPPGSYTFEVQAGIGGVWSRPAALTVVRAPLFWETRWFPVLLLLAGLGLVAGAVRGRIRALRRRQAELEATVEERTEALRRQKEQIEEQATQLLALDHVKSQFFANLSHELRTPLTLILGPLEDLLAGRATPSVELHRRMHRNAQRLFRLVNQFLDLTRLESGALVLAPRQQDLAAFLRRLAGAFDGLAQARHVALRFDLPDGPVLHVFDADRVEKVVLNLLSNAFKFTPEGGVITVALAKGPDGEARVSVRDTGIGIAPEHRARLFDRFYQADATTTRRHEGSGIGLALARELVELHGGTLSVESTPGEGSLFSFTLPAQPAAAPSGNGAMTGPPDHPGDAAEAWADAVQATLGPDPTVAAEVDVPEDASTVLVVEDNPDMRAYLCTQLDGAHSVVEAPDGAAGLERARTLVPDLIVSDVMMPEMDGYALCRALKEDPRTSHIPVILLTARADAESRIEGLETGADAYLPKPFNARELHVRVEQLIEGRRRLRERYAQDVLVLGARAVTMPSMEQAFLDRIREAVEAHLADADFGVDALAVEVGMSGRQLRRKLKALLDETPNALVRRMRLERAAQLLHQQALSVKEVADAVGFRSESHFSRLFRETYGVPPGAFAQQEGGVP